MLKKDFAFSKHYREDEDVCVELAMDCVNTGKKSPEQPPDKFKARRQYRLGELTVIYRDYGEYFFVITAFWNERRKHNES